MSVVVRMEMPENCCKCQLRQEDYDTGEEFCPFTGVECLSIGRQDNCPIICQLPEGHGDLIDRDVLLQTFQNADYETYNDYCEAFDTTEAAETIVPAEAERSET